MLSAVLYALNCINTKGVYTLVQLLLQKTKSLDVYIFVYSMYMHDMCAWYQSRSEDNVQFPGTGVMNN